MSSSLLSKSPESASARSDSAFKCSIASSSSLVLAASASLARFDASTALTCSCCASREAIAASLARSRAASNWSASSDVLVSNPAPAVSDLDLSDLSASSAFSTSTSRAANRPSVSCSAARSASISVPISRIVASFRSSSTSSRLILSSSRALALSAAFLPVSTSSPPTRIADIFPVASSNAATASACSSPFALSASCAASSWARSASTESSAASHRSCVALSRSVTCNAAPSALLAWPAMAAAFASFILAAECAESSLAQSASNCASDARLLDSNAEYRAARLAIATTLSSSCLASASFSRMAPRAASLAWLASSIASFFARSIASRSTASAATRFCRPSACVDTASASDACLAACASECFSSDRSCVEFCSATARSCITSSLAALYCVSARLFACDIDSTSSLAPLTSDSIAESFRLDVCTSAIRLSARSFHVAISSFIFCIRPTSAAPEDGDAPDSPRPLSGDLPLLSPVFPCRVTLSTSRFRSSTCLINAATFGATSPAPTSPPDD